MIPVYCIPGMGVDKRLFKNVAPQTAELRFIEWIEPQRDETLASYAQRLSKQIDTSAPFALMGVSFGGMCAVEIAKVLHPVKTFVVSSCKTSAQLPFKITFWRHFKMYKKLSDQRYIKAALFLRKQFGVTGAEQTQRFSGMLHAAPANYFSGAVHCIVNWENEIIPTSVVQIHGTSDLVLPYLKTKYDYTIGKGSHFMIVNRAAEISAIIDKELAAL